jgi:superfamily I DNA/RNA helicase
MADAAGPDRAAFAADDVVVYLAAAGAGKTSALMDEMTALLGTYRPDEIAFVTYTRKGVEHGMERALQANPQLAADDLVHFRTLHSLCFRALGLTRASMITRARMQEFNRTASFRITLSGEFEKQTDDDRLLARYDALRGGGTRGMFAHGGYDEVKYRRFVRDYEAFKERKGLADFTDCLIRFRDAGKPVGARVAFIDEAQDLTLLQWEVCRTAFSLAEKVRIAGDDCQSLFTYAGASPGMLVSLARQYRTVRLETSYRLPGAVYRFAKGITRMIGAKTDKDFRPAKDSEGFVRKEDDRNVLIRCIRKDMKEHGLAPYRWYLLFRNNCFIDETAALLEQHAIPYHTARGFCIPKEDLAKIRRFYNYRKDGFGTREAFGKFCRDYGIKDINGDFTESGLIASEKRYCYLDYVDRFGVDALAGMAEKEPFLLLSTTHRVKGGEADFVAVFLDCTRRVAGNMAANMDEELRVLYVACTRAKAGLFLMSRKGKYGLDGIIDMVKEQEE